MHQGRNNAAESLRSLQWVAVGVTSLLIILVVFGEIGFEGWDILVDKFGYVPYGLAFWLTTGTISGLIAGRMNIAVLIANRYGEPFGRNALDSLILAFTCRPIGKGRVMQFQIAQLIAGGLGLGIVWSVCQLIYCATDASIFGTFPGGLLALFPLVFSWKIVERFATSAMTRSTVRSEV